MKKPTVRQLKQYIKKALGTLCFVGIHKPNNDWIIKWSSQREYCNCKRCGRYIVHGTRITYSQKEFYRHF